VEAAAGVLREEVEALLQRAGVGDVRGKVEWKRRRTTSEIAAEHGPPPPPALRAAGWVVFCAGMVKHTNAKPSTVDLFARK
jgi:hypothetical protein